MTKCKHCGHELELVSMNNGKPAFVLIIDENRRYAGWECSQCGVLHLIREKFEP